MARWRPAASERRPPCIRCAIPMLLTYFEAGINLRQIQSYLGHNTLRTTSRYTHPSASLRTGFDASRRRSGRQGHRPAHGRPGVIELAHIFRRHGADYQAKFAERMLPSHRQAMRAIINCRTDALGGHVYHCDHCDEDRYTYHSCRNPPLSQVPTRRRGAMASEATGLPAARALLPAHLHPACRTESAHPQQPKGDLQSTLPGFGNGHTATRS